VRRWNMLGRRLGRRLVATYGASKRPGRPATPVELRVYLPLLWPEGPDGPVDRAAVSALGRDYARAGRVMDELLDDLDILCSVVGIGASSSMIEASTVAWSDAFLDAVTAGSDLAPLAGTGSASSPDATAVDEVARRLAAFRGTAWGDLAPSGRLLVVTWSSDPSAAELLEEIGRVIEEVRRLFPGAVVAQQPQHRRVVAAVTDTGATDVLVRTLRLRCTELVTSAAPVITIARVDADDDLAQRLLRSAW
jgi:hypothetical protein